ncbi:hypothetical protein C4O86_07295 [Pasteurellaceae bacterium 12565]|nr:hypothetical protein C4O86_07295 [Pasteurellaceae bacterium 12565]
MLEIKRQVTILRPTNYGKEENHYKHLYILLTDPCFDESFKFFLLFKNKISQELIFSYGDSSKYLFIK